MNVFITCKFIKMTQKRAINILIWKILLLHVASTKVIPYEIAWGGKLKSDTQMYLFESISILVTLSRYYITYQRELCAAFYSYFYC